MLEINFKMQLQYKKNTNLNKYVNKKKSEY